MRAFIIRLSCRNINCIILCSAWLATMPLPLRAQQMMYLEDSSVKVYAYGQERRNAWCGGFDHPQFTIGDLNNDGLADLVVFEPQNSLRTFINEGVPGSPLYVYRPEYELNFPPIFNYVTLADYNCDGIPDLFQQSAITGSGFSVYRGYYNTQNQLCFTYYKDLFYYDSSIGMQQPAGNPPENTPAIVDVDHDGDLDFLSYNADALEMFFFKNMRVELGLPCDSIQIELADYCWGHFFAPTGFPYFILGCLGGITSRANECIIDYNMDGSYDFMGSNSEYSNLSLLLNGKRLTGPDSMVTEDTVWQAGVPLNLPNSRPAVFNVDVDQDGKKDMLISPTFPSDNYNCIWYYKNLSTPGVANWQFQSDTFLIDQTIDLGSAAYPMLFDYSGDGLPDLFIGSGGYYQDSSQKLVSRLSYYQNTSTPGHPSLTLETTNLLHLDTFNFQGAAPASGDINNDGNADLIIGHTNGLLSYFKNRAASGAATPDWQLAELVLTDVNGDTINVGGDAAPFIYDVDKDGRNDLVIGSYWGYLQYYRNVGTAPGVIGLQLVTTRLGNAAAGYGNTYPNYSAPFIGKIDTTGTDYLLLGSMSGNIYQYAGVASGDTSAPYTLLDTQYSFIDSTYNFSNHPHPAGVFNYGDLQTTLTVGDIAGDGSLFMITGNNKGGVQLYKLQYPPGLATNTVAQAAGGISLYPNPAKDLLHVVWRSASAATQVSILNMLGQHVYTAAVPANEQTATLPVSVFPAGVYICEVQSGQAWWYGKFSVVK